MVLLKSASRSCKKRGGFMPEKIGEIRDRSRCSTALELCLFFIHPSRFLASEAGPNDRSSFFFYLVFSRFQLEIFPFCYAYLYICVRVLGTTYFQGSLRPIRIIKGWEVTFYTLMLRKCSVTERKVMKIWIFKSLEICVFSSLKISGSDYLNISRF